MSTLADRLSIATTAEMLLERVSEVHPYASQEKAEIFWVGSNTSGAADTQNAGTYDKQFNTLAYAVSQCADGRGDTIVVSPKHTEALAAKLSIDKSRVQIVGLWNAAVSSIRADPGAGKYIEIAAPGVMISGLELADSVGSTTPIVDVVAAGAGSVICGCFFDGSAETLGIRIQADGCTIAANQFRCSAPTAGATHAILGTTTHDRCEIVQNDFYVLGAASGGSDVPLIKLPVAGASGMIIAHNTFYNINAQAGDLIEVAGECLCFKNEGNPVPGTSLSSIHNAANTARVQEIYTNDLTKAGAAV